MAIIVSLFIFLVVTRRAGKESVTMQKSTTDQGMEEFVTVFFSTYKPEDYDRYGRGLVEDDVPMDLNSPERIGLRPDWSARPGRSNYFMFNLHSLRFAYSLIEPAARGDIEALGRARDLFLYWDECNPVGSIGWQDEHSV